MPSSVLMILCVHTLTKSICSPYFWPQLSLFLQFDKVSIPMTFKKLFFFRQLSKATLPILGDNYVRLDIDSLKLTPNEWRVLDTWINRCFCKIPPQPIPRRHLPFPVAVMPTISHLWRFSTFGLVNPLVKILLFQHIVSRLWIILISRLWIILISF